jgi:hypothetical protein
MSDRHDLEFVVRNLAIDNGVGIGTDQHATGATDQGPPVWGLDSLVGAVTNGSDETTIQASDTLVVLRGSVL